MELRTPPQDGPQASRTLVLCSGNPGKLVELRAMLPPGMEVLTLKDVGVDGDLPETGTTLESNALQKARTVFGKCGLPCVADDTGLEVDALDGAPGVYSARYAGEARDPIANMRKLLSELEGEEGRTARFRTVIALVGPQGERTFEGRVEGTIIRSPRGALGFGYDPVFLPSGSGRTFAEMDVAAKNAISHRGRAMRALVAYLTDGRSVRGTR